MHPTSRACLTRFRSSPLNTAFYTGNVDGVRLLLDRNADIEYTNRRKWTSARYLYDPEGTNPHSLELLDVCAGLGFDGWNSQDQVGWTLFHRASAFGHGSDIKKLLNLGADSNILTYTLLWLPIFCAVTFGNESTFDVLVDLIPLRSLPNLKDSRGWTLLHSAAENGSEVIMTRLLQRSLDPFAKSDKSTLGVPEGLPFEELTSGEIARFCNHQEAYEQALNNAGYLTIGTGDPNELLLQEPG
jgi:ankyrin repeat protein